MGAGHSHSHSMAEMSQAELKYRRKAALLSLVFGTLIMSAKFYAYKLTGSQGAFSDALESIVNIFTAAMVLFVIYYSAKPADEDHPYGHGKVEYFSAAFEGGLITLAAFTIFYEAVQSILSGHELQSLQQGSIWLIGAGVANFILGMAMVRMGNKANSPALRGSGHHILSDVWTSVGVVVGLFLVQLTGFKSIDLAVAILAGAYLDWVGLKIVKNSIGDLLDEEDVDVLEELAEVFGKHAGQGIIQIHHTKVIRSGWFHHIDAHVVVPEFWTVHEAHDRLNLFEKSVISDYKYKGEMNFHIDPCLKNYCKNCDLTYCNIRKHEFEKPLPVLLEHLRSKEEPLEATD